jgi:hypothetical protein
MSTELINKELKDTNIDMILDEIRTRSEGIPFGNSKFQNLNFVLKSELTPARASRHCLLRLNDRINALMESKYSMAKEDEDIEIINIEIEELEYLNSKLAEELNSNLTSSSDIKLNEFQIRKNKAEINKKKIELEQKEANRKYASKMILDAIEEVKDLYGALKGLPHYTREEFEAEEEEHFTLTQLRGVAGVQGHMQSLMDMGYDVSAIKDMDLSVAVKNMQAGVKRVSTMVDKNKLLGGIEDDSKI